MAKWNDAWHYDYKRDFGGESFAEIDIAGQAYEKHGYRSPAWTTGKFTLWVHEGTGLVTANPSALVDWMRSLPRVVSSDA